MLDAGTPSVSLSARSQGLQIRSGGAVPPDTAQPDDVALLLHTSGTTSRPKAVPLSHGNLRASLTNIAATYQLSGRDRHALPWLHAGMSTLTASIQLCQGQGWAGVAQEPTIVCFTSWA